MMYIKLLIWCGLLGHDPWDLVPELAPNEPMPIFIMAGEPSWSAGASGVQT